MFALEDGTIFGSKGSFEQSQCCGKDIERVWILRETSCSVSLYHNAYRILPGVAAALYTSCLFSSRFGAKHGTSRRPEMLVVFMAEELCNATSTAHARAPIACSAPCQWQCHDHCPARLLAAIPTRPPPHSVPGEGHRRALRFAVPQHSRLLVAFAGVPSRKFLSYSSLR